MTVFMEHLKFKTGTPNTIAGVQATQPLYNTIAGVQANFLVSYPIRVIKREKYIDI